MSAALAESPPNPTAIIPKGAIIGRKYRVDDVIVEGGMGVVYRGWHVVLEQPIAIKVVRSEYANHPEAIARFLNEARSNARLHGIHVVRVLDTGRIEDGPPYMVLEYLEGHDLRAVLEERGPLSLEQALDYVLQCCEAMAEAHALGIVHRDLKPENLFLTRLPDGSDLVKVIDFGISKRLDNGGRSYTMHGQSLGSPHYMAPEQMTAPDRVDGRADIWSLGVVLFELLTNAVPFEGETLPAACVNVMCNDPTSLRVFRPDLPPQLDAVIARCLEKDPDQRFQSIKEVALALLPFASHESAKSIERVERIVDGPDASPPESITRPTPLVRPISAIARGHMRLPTPLAHARSTDEPAFKPRERAIWPLGVVFAGLAVLAILSDANPRELRRVAGVAAQQIGVVAERGLRELGIEVGAGALASDPGRAAASGKVSPDPNGAENEREPHAPPFHAKFEVNAAKPAPADTESAPPRASSAKPAPAPRRHASAAPRTRVAPAPVKAREEVSSPPPSRALTGLPPLPSVPPPLAPPRRSSASASDADRSDSGDSTGELLPPYGAASAGTRDLGDGP